MKLQGEFAIVTGAASGFGAEIARQYAAERCQVAVADTNDAGAQAVVTALGARAIAVRCDVTPRADINTVTGTDAITSGRRDLIGIGIGVCLGSGIRERRRTLWRKNEQLENQIAGGRSRKPNLHNLPSPIASEKPPESSAVKTMVEAWVERRSGRQK